MQTRSHWYLPSFWTVLTIIVCTGFFLGRNTPKNHLVLGMDVITRGWPCVTDFNMKFADRQKWAAENNKPLGYYPSDEVSAVLMPNIKRFPFLYTDAFNISFQVIATIVLAALVEAFVRRRRQKQTDEAKGSETRLRWHQISLSTMLVGTITAGAMIGLNAMPRRVEIAGVEVNAYGLPWTSSWTWNQESVKRWQVEHGKPKTEAPFGEVMDTLDVGYRGKSELSMAYDVFCGIVVIVCVGAAAEGLLRRSERMRKLKTTN